MCKTKPCNATISCNATIMRNNSPTLVTPSRNSFGGITPNYQLVNLSSAMNESDVVDLVCFEDVLDDEEEEVDKTEIVDTAVGNAIEELASVRAEVERVYQRFAKNERNGHRKSTVGNISKEKQEERTGGLDGWIGIDGMRKKEKVVKKKRN